MGLVSFCSSSVMMSTVGRVKCLLAATLFNAHKLGLNVLCMSYGA